MQMNERRSKIQLHLAFPEEERSETPGASEEGTESFAAKRSSEHPALLPTKNGVPRSGTEAIGKTPERQPKAVVLLPIEFEGISFINGKCSVLDEKHHKGFSRKNG
ncbi:MAG: hypothetical protein ACKPHU_21420, partial [Planctomycetaceae bacterium]